MKIQTIFIVLNIQLFVASLFSNDASITRETAFLWVFGSVVIDLVVFGLWVKFARKGSGIPEAILEAERRG